MKSKKRLIKKTPPITILEKCNKRKSKILTFVKETDVEYLNFKQRSNKIIDESWDFKKSDTKEFTHCFHSYPAMMIPQVARRIISIYGKESDLLFDPFCGTGTSLVEANLNGMNAIGTDINPLARLIANAKTTKIDDKVLDKFVNNFKDYVFSVNFNINSNNSVIIPEIKNKDFWFSKIVQQKLAIILNHIKNIDNIFIMNFFKVAFSETVREASNVKNGEFKLVRNKNFKEKRIPDVFGLMISKLTRNKNGLSKFVQTCKNGSKTYVFDFDSVESIPTKVVNDESIDIIVTSPPYGDSRTTVAYGQYSRLANEWLGYKNANQVDNSLMGGKRRKHSHVFKCELLNNVIETIQKQDKERVRDVISFFEDYERSINNVSKVLKKGGFACYVVGNRTVKGVNIPTDEITAQLFIENEFNHIETIVRNIPNKRMPLKNSPSNKSGVTASTMKNEFIVVCKKK